MEKIPQEWIKSYVDKLLQYAAKLPEGSPMRNSAILRAGHAMGLVKAFRDNPKNFS